MTEPKQYVINLDTPDHVYLKNGFKKYSDHFSISKYLYKDLIRLSISIYNKSNYLSINVVGNDNSTYAPFFDPSVRHDNLVYETVAQKYNSYMDNLVRKKILKRKKKERNKKNEQ